MCLACFIAMADRPNISHLPSPEGCRRYCIRSALGLLLLCLLAIPRIEAEPLRLSEYQKQKWQVENGLPENQVRSITQLPGGSLLLVTSGGIATFDGITFNPYKDESNNPLTNEAVNALLVRRNGELWIGTDEQRVLRQQKNHLVNISERALGIREEVKVELLLEGKRSRSLRIASITFYTSFKRPLVTLCDTLTPHTL
jgi:hypothetical protein